MKLLAPNRTISALLILASIVITLFNLASYAGVFSPLPTPPQNQISLPGLPEQTAVLHQQPGTTTSNQTLFRLLPALIGIGFILAGGLVTSLVLLSVQRQRKQRDTIRMRNLDDIAAIFERYYNQHGHYPVSTTYDAQYYSAINILTEWESYNFPPLEEMRQLDTRWPLSDPILNPTSKDQSGNYLYYPHHFGQRFSLYAQLEAPTQNPVPDYNVIDQLPPTAGRYNFRFNGPDHHVEASPQAGPSNQVTPTLSTQANPQP